MIVIPTLKPTMMPKRLPDANTKFLLNFAGGNYNDESTNPDTVTLSGGSVIVGGGPYGLNCFRIDSTAGYLQVDDTNVKFSFSGNYTLEFYFYLASNSYQRPCGQQDFQLASVYDLSPASVCAGQWTGATSEWITTGLTSMTVGNWYHVAIVRSSNVIYEYVNGSVASNTISYSGDVGNGSSYPWYLGKDQATCTGGQNCAIGTKFASVRLSNVARYTSNFTPPTGILR